MNVAEEQRGGLYALARRTFRNTTAVLDKLSGRSLRIITLLVFLVLLVVCLTYDATAVMWLDEIHGYYVLQLGNISSISQALIDGVDNSAPIYLFICLALKPVLGTSAFALRFPSAIGFFVACVCIYVFLSRRLGQIYALLGVFVLSSAAMYSIEGRPYGLAIGCVSAAVVAWQSAANQRSRRLSLLSLFISLSLAISDHYWSIFVLPSIAIAEWVRCKASRRVDSAMALAVTLPAFALLADLPFINAVRRFMPFFWSKPFFPLDSRFMLAGLFGNLPMAAVIVVPAVICFLKPWQGKDSRAELPTLRSYEWALVTGMAVTPYALLIIAALTTRIFQDRYVVWSAFGITAFLAALLARYASSRLAAVLACVIVGLFTVDHWIKAFAHRDDLRIGEPIRRLLNDVSGAPEPIVIAAHQPFMELAFYETPSIRRRLVYLDNGDLERYYTATDTGSLLMSAVKAWTAVNIQDYCGFLHGHREFLLAADAEDWLPWHLSASGYRLTPIHEGWHPVLYKVEAPLQPRTPPWIRDARIKLTCSN